MEKVQGDIHKLQLIEENLHAYLAQKQQVQSQIMEFESASDALKDSPKAFKIVGNLMIERGADELRTDLDAQLEKARLRINAIEKQEALLKEKAEGLQKKVMETMKK